MKGAYSHGSSKPGNFPKAEGRRVPDVWGVPFFVSKIWPGSASAGVVGDAELDNVRKGNIGASFIEEFIDTPKKKTYSMLFYLPDEECFFRKKKDSLWFSGHGSELMRYINSGCKKYLTSNAFAHDVIHLANQVIGVVDSVPEKIMSSDAPYVELCNLELNVASDKINSLKQAVSKLDPKSEGYIKGCCLIAKMSHAYYSAMAELERIIWRGAYDSVILDKSWPLMSGGVSYPESKVLGGHKIKNAIRAELKKCAEVYTKQPSSVITKAVPVGESAFRKKASHLGLKLNLPRRTLRVSEMPITLKCDSGVSSVGTDEKALMQKANSGAIISGTNIPPIGDEHLRADDLFHKAPAATKPDPEHLDSFSVVGKVFRRSSTHIDTPFVFNFKKTSKGSSSRLL